MHRAPGEDGPVEVCRASHEVVPAFEMRGIEDDYTVRHLYTDATLREEIYRPDQEVSDFLAPTRAFLAKAGFYGLERAL
jgi:hypothetical protein